MRDTREVESATKHVRGYQDLGCPAGKVIEVPKPFLLTLVPVDSHSMPACPPEMLYQGVGKLLRHAEDDCLRHSDALQFLRREHHPRRWATTAHNSGSRSESHFQELQKARALPCLPCLFLLIVQIKNLDALQDVAVRDHCVRHARRADAEEHWCNPAEAAGQRASFLWPGGREEERLPDECGAACERVNLIPEPLLQHPVALIQHKNADGPEDPSTLFLLLANKVKKPARCRHYDGGAALQSPLLLSP
mmetsp:Transcript_65213/g.210262  ORF Transcript_65213/g.210262 Transcript_65213/m.210262 type:complete len:249 (-) Transcript_65213:632-1378(-)